MSRQDRRQEHQESLRRYRAGGLPPQIDLAAMFAHTAMLLRLLGARTDPSRARRAAAAYHEGFATSMATWPSERPVACRAGCSLCCHNWIAASAPEVLLIAADLSARPDAVAVAESVAAAARLGHGLDRDARLERRLACPLLEASLCSIYAVRPIACRAFFSLSLEACQRVYAGTGDEVPAARRAMMLRGVHDRCMWAAMKGAGLAHGCWELTEALSIALAEPDAEARWLAGEDVFAGATPDGLVEDEEELFLDVLVAGALGRRLPDNPWTGA